MQHRQHFLVDNAIVLVAQVISKLRGILTLPLLVKGLGGEAYGTWSQLLSFSVLASALFNMNLHIPLVRFLNPDKHESARTYLTLLLASVSISSALGLLVLVAVRTVDITLLVGRPDRLLLGLGVGLAMVNGIRSLNLNYYRAKAKLLIRSVIDLTGSLLELTGVIVVLNLGFGLHAAFGALLASGALIAILTTAMILTSIGVAAPSWATLTQGLRFSTPLIPATVCMWVLDRSDRFLLAHHLGQLAVGTYSAQYALAALLSFAQAPLQITLIPRVAQAWDHRRAEALELLALSLRMYLAMAIPFLVIGPLLGPPSLVLLATPQMAIGAALNILLIALGLGAWGVSVLLSSVLYGAKQTRLVSRATFFGAFANVALNLLMIPRLGIVAAAASTAFTYLITLAAFATSARSLARVDFAPREALRSVLAAVLAGVPVWLIAPTSALGIAATALLFLLCYVGLLFLLGARLPASLGRAAARPDADT